MCIEQSSYLYKSDSFSIEPGDWLEVHDTYHLTHQKTF